MVVLVGLGLLGSFASVALAFSIAEVIADLAHSKSIDSGLYLWFAVGLAIKVFLPWLQEYSSARVTARVKTQFRKQLLETDFATADISSAEITILATRGLDSLDAYFGKFLPQFVYAMVVTPLLVVLFFFADPLSALILVFTIPLIPLFMIFIGIATKTEQDRQFESLNKLGSHFSEIVKGISTLKLFSRIEHQQGVLTDIGEKLRMRTMKVLRISFLSGFALELAASLSVALIAVTIGFRLIDGHVAFSLAMFLLILAPDAYLPIRMIGANYHASTEGIAAASKILDVLSIINSEYKSPWIPKPGLELWIGPSGSGKSKELDKLISGGNLSKLAWMPQDPSLIPGTVLGNIVGFEKPDAKVLKWVWNFCQLNDVDSNQELDDFGRGLSGGQAQRVSLARALYRFKTKNLKVLVLDEPTSSVDSKNADSIWRELKNLSEQDYSITVITHQVAYQQLADRLVNFEK